MTKDKDSIRISQSRNGHISIDQSLPQPEHGHGMKKSMEKVALRHIPQNQSAINDSKLGHGTI